MSFAGRPGGDNEVDKGRVAATQVKRYRPGQAPDWIKEEDAEASASDEEMKEVSFAALHCAHLPMSPRACYTQQRTHIAALVCSHIQATAQPLQAVWQEHLFTNALCSPAGCP